MATYAIGDIQGCYSALQRLLEKIGFNPQHDALWFTGDLVNRGPQSLETLRFIKQLGEREVTVLGNHDLHLLAVAHGLHSGKPQDTLQGILDAPDFTELCDWLRQQPLLYHDPTLNYTMVHAGIPAQWDLSTALSHAHEVESALRSPQYAEFLAHLYGAEPSCWDNNLSGWPRLRLITNYFTRMRFCTAAGQLDLKHKMTSIDSAEYLPWFQLPNRQNRDLRIIFGHWAALRGKTSAADVYALDTGCVWGDCLTAMRLEDQQRFSVACK